MPLLTFRNVTMIKACRENLQIATCPTSACLEMFLLNTHHGHENHVITAMDPFNPAAASSIDCLLRETNLPWKPSKHLLLSVTCSLQLSKVLQPILQKPWGSSNNKSEGKAKASLGLNSYEVLFLTNEAYYRHIHFLLYCAYTVTPTLHLWRLTLRQCLYVFLY